MVACGEQQARRNNNGEGPLAHRGIVDLRPSADSRWVSHATTVGDAEAKAETVGHPSPSRSGELRA